MAIELRTITPDEVGAFCHSVMVPFLQPHDVEAAESWVAEVEADRAVVAVDRGRFVANACTYTRDLTLPAGPGPCPTVPVAAVSAVGVHASHRRRGLLRSLMQWLHDDARRRGEPFAALTASESSIYGRFGYGLATSTTEVAIATDRAAFSVPAPDLDIALLRPEEAAKVVPDLFDRLRRRRAGEINRNAAVWDHLVADRPAERDGASARFWAVAEDGFATYRARNREEHGLTRTRLIVDDLYGASPDVEAALWRFVLDVDLVHEVVGLARPLDEALRWRLVEPRQLRVTSSVDRLWLCLLDVAAALEARGYDAEGRLVFEVHGTDPASSGGWVLDAGPDGASCRRARPGDAVDLRVGWADLGAIYLGGVAPSVLAAAGRVAEVRPGALGRADALFATRSAPFTGTGF